LRNGEFNPATDTTTGIATPLENLNVETEEQAFDRLQESMPEGTVKVGLDTFLYHITHQERVKLISKLAIKESTEEYYDSNSHITRERIYYEYFDNSYHFKLKTYEGPDFGGPSAKAILYDGDKKIVFKNYKVLSYIDSLKDDYGFDFDNNLDSPSIIEVCGKRFLYSNVMFSCNGSGCGCRLTMIYDIEKKQPSFIENFRINFDGYYLSDFDGDSVPDLLVISQEYENRPAFPALSKVTLYDYNYKAGEFIPLLDIKSEPVRYKLIGGIDGTEIYPNLYLKVR
jgi:hypothetical protein